MREFKFRAWENNKMYYQVRCGGMFDNIPTAPTVWNESVGDWLNLTGQPHTKIMQYVGVKDKNGKEIYEGDVLKTDLSRPYIIVEFRNGAFVYLCHDSGEDYHDFMMNLIEERESDDYLEIVGNIYENPEILNSFEDNV